MPHRTLTFEDAADGYQEATRQQPRKSPQFLAGLWRQYSDARNMVRTRHVDASSAGFSEPYFIAWSK